MRFNCDRMITFEDMRRITGLQDFETTDSVYTNVLDEGIILEQTPSDRVTFVYDEFMEYTMARDILTNNLNINDEEKLHLRLKRILRASRRFNSIYGVVSYLLPMLEKD